MNEEDMGGNVQEPDGGSTVPGFGWAVRLVRWARNDITVRGMDGPLPPRRTGRRSDSLDRTDDFDQQALLFGSANGMLGLIGGSLQQFFNEPRQRHDLYRIYEMMDKTEMPSTFLDLVADETCHIDPEHGRRLWVKCENGEMQAEGDRALRRWRTEEEIRGQARDTAKFGDNFERLTYLAGPNGGVFRMIPQHPTEIMRKEGRDGKLEGYTQNGKKYKGQHSDVSYPWDYVHFRVRGQDRYWGYGTSFMKNGIPPWRRLQILTDWMMHYQTSRAPDRNMLILDMGAASEVDAAEVQRRFRQKLKRTMIVDPTGVSGKNLDYNYAPMVPQDDLILAVRHDSKTRVEKFPGSPNGPDMLPIQYCVDSFFSAVRAPKNFFGWADPVQPANLKASLCSQDIKFARRCRDLQVAMRLGYSWMLELHYTLLMGNDPENTRYDFTQEGRGFRVHMGPISFLEELEMLEILQLRQAIAMGLMDMSRENAAFKAAEYTSYVLRTVMKIPKRELDRLLNTSSELVAAQSALMNAKPANVNVAPAVGAAAQAKMGQDQMKLQRDAQAMSAVPPPEETGNQQEDREDALDYDCKMRIQDAVEEARARGPQNGGEEMTAADKRVLSEMLDTDPRLRMAVIQGAKLWREDGDQLSTDGLALPVRTELHEKGLLHDDVTQADLEEIAHEAVRGARKAGG